MLMVVYVVGHVLAVVALAWVHVVACVILVPLVAVAIVTLHVPAAVVVAMEIVISGAILDVTLCAKMTVKKRVIQSVLKHAPVLVKHNVPHAMAAVHAEDAITVAVLGVIQHAMRVHTPDFRR